MSLKLFARLLAACTFLLLLVGGLVHGTGSGLACPDWPLCFGSALPRMTGHILYEHSHRLVAGTVALLTTGLAIAITLRRKELARLAWFAVGLVVVQALLGALTVWLKLPAIVSTAHLAVSMLFFATTLYLAWRLDDDRLVKQVALPPAQRRWIPLALAVTYGQILLGGVVRHTGSGLACIDFPLCHGSLLPLSAHPSVILQATHRLMAVLVAIAIIFASVGVLRAGASFARTLAILALALVATQITLGALSVLSFLELFRVTAHLGVAALLLAVLVWLTLSTRLTTASAS